MKIAVITIIIVTFISNTLSSRVNATTIMANLLPSKTISYQVHLGYEDINWYMQSSQAAIFYSLWESSTRRFTDHSTPVIFYLSGGPGLSSQYSAFREFGPIQIDKKGDVYTGFENPWSWNYYAHLVFVDQPIGAGFSYNKGKVVDNSKTAAQHFTNFLSNFLKNNPFGLSTNPFYLAGEGFAGHYIPAIISHINSNSSFGIKISGMILGGGFVDPERQINHWESFLESAGIVSLNQRNSTSENINSAILKIRNSKLAEALPFIQSISSKDASAKYYNGMSIQNYKRYTDDLTGTDYVGFLNSRKKDLGVPDDVTFVESNLAINNAFAEDMFVSYVKGIEEALKGDLRVLIYNGQNDFSTNTAGVVTYLQNLQWPYSRDWRESRKEIWKESGKISGWVKRYKNLIFVVVKGTGHHVYEDESASERSIYLMLNNYFSQKW